MEILLLWKWKTILHWWYVAKLEVTNISFLFWKVTPWLWSWTARGQTYSLLMLSHNFFPPSLLSTQLDRSTNNGNNTNSRVVKKVDFHCPSTLMLLPQTTLQLCCIFVFYCSLVLPWIFINLTMNSSFNRF